MNTTSLYTPQQNLSASLDSEIQALGGEILKRTESQPKLSLFSKDFWYGSIMDWSMKNESFKTQMFRFVDVLPSLQSGSEVARHLKEYFAEGGEQLPAVFNMGVGLGSLAPGLMAGAIRKNVTQMAKMFITGENPQEALVVLKKNRKNQIGFTVDILGEATLSEKEAQDYFQKYLELIDWLSRDSEKWDEIPLIDRDHRGAIPKVNVSVKLSALYSQINDLDWANTKETLKDKLRPVFQRAMQKNIFLNLDMEHYAIKDLTLEVFSELVCEPEFKAYPFFGCVIQAYLRDSYADLKKMIQVSKSRTTPLTVRLVKGAYWDSETLEAEQKRWKIPVYSVKAESDANYEDCAELILKNFPNIFGAFGTHNVRSMAATIKMAEKLNVPKTGYEFQMLFGMADPIKKSLVDLGYRVREYAPVGELIPGMAYLVRRLLENTSNESWLRSKFAEGSSNEKLLRNPAAHLVPSTGELTNLSHLFYNEAPLDFAVLSNREKMQAALTKKSSTFPVSIPALINGQKIESAQTHLHQNPSRSSQTVSKVSLSSIDTAQKALDSAHKNFQQVCKKIDFKERSQHVSRLADLMVARRFDLMATQILEVGKPWAEADGDVTEAIDFCRYYARDILQISQPLKVGSAPGEASHYIYQPRGVAVCIAPWNFPLAILCGMAVAAYVTGNSVILKPAEQSSLVAYELFQMMLEAGFPADTIQFLPGKGEDVGAALVNSPVTSTIAFTGSKAVGLQILQAASVVHPRQHFIKRTILELGGKNALIIDNDADLDEAVDATLYSAFGYAGQKCSAASRVLVHEDVYDKYTERLKEAARSLTQGPSDNPASYYGPVIDKEAQQRILNLISEAKKANPVLFEGAPVAGGCFVPATLFGPVAPESTLAQEEIFGPVLALIKVKSMSHAIEVANQTQYALTGGLFSRSPSNIEFVKNNFEVGNLYVNRGITGAMVDRHPFGGFKLSGIGSKTGGPDYLKQFMEPRVITENLIRRGFAPTE